MIPRVIRKPLGLIFFFFNEVYVRPSVRAFTVVFSVLLRRSVLVASRFEPFLHTF